MKKLYIILIAALLLTLAACLTACSAKPVSLRGTEAPNLPGPTNDARRSRTRARTGTSPWSR